MQNYPLFPRAVRLILYAGTALASLAGVPAVVRHARQAMAPMSEEESNAAQVSNVPVQAHHADSRISIQPVQSDAAARRKEELLALQAKLATIHSSK
jgi:hypothetical protein